MHRAISRGKICLLFTTQKMMWFIVQMCKKYSFITFLTNTMKAKAVFFSLSCTFKVKSVLDMKSYCNESWEDPSCAFIYWPINVEAARRLGDVGPRDLSTLWEAQLTSSDMCVCVCVWADFLETLHHVQETPANYHEIQEMKLFHPDPPPPPPSHFSKDRIWGRLEN